MRKVLNLSMAVKRKIYALFVRQSVFAANTRQKCSFPNREGLNYYGCGLRVSNNVCEMKHDSEKSQTDSLALFIFLYYLATTTYSQQQNLSKLASFVDLLISR